MSYNVTMKRGQKPRSGVAFGGLGTGSFELRQDGQFYNWNIFNNLPLGTGPFFTWDHQSVLFFLIRYQVEGSTPRICLLQIEEGQGAAAMPSYQYTYPWMSGVETIRYSASFPFVNLEFSEKRMPLKISLNAWSPFIPHNVKDSALPVAFFDFRIESTASKPVAVSVFASMRNCAGYDTAFKSWTGRAIRGDNFAGFIQGAKDMDVHQSSYGTMSMASLDKRSASYIGWEHFHPYYERLLREPVLPEVNDIAGRNHPDKETGRPTCIERCFSTTGKTAVLNCRGELLNHTFIAAWHFPNCHAHTENHGGLEHGYLENENFPGNTPDATKPKAIPGTKSPAYNEGVYYANHFKNAEEVITYAVENRKRLKEETRRFYDAFYTQSVEVALLDQINSQLNTFRTSSWLTRHGDFGILEGLTQQQSYAGFSTIDVAMYGGICTAALFPELDRAVMRSHKRFQTKKGIIAHTIQKNFHTCSGAELSGQRIDLPAQYAYQALRAWSWSQDKAFLKEMWPSIKAALEYILRERDKNGDGLPDMEGIMCSYDNFPMYGVTPYVGGQWLVAIASAIEAAKVMNDAPAASRYKEIWNRSREVMETRCWNGSYYRLYNDPEKGCDEGCLSDQMLGQWCAHLAGLPLPFDTKRARTALKSILKSNYKPDQGLRNCQWPEDEFLHDVAPDCWCDQANTCWTGVELAFASLLIYEGMEAEGLRIVRNVDRRYRHWGIYWDHQEFGGHYFRPMSAWAILHALAGYRLNNGQITFEPSSPKKQRRILFTTAHGYGHFVTGPKGASIQILSGELREKSLRIKLPTTRVRRVKVSYNGRAWPDAEVENGTLCFNVRIPPHIQCRAGDSLTFKYCH